MSDGANYNCSNVYGCAQVEISAASNSVSELLKPSLAVFNLSNTRNRMKSKKKNDL